MKFTLLLTAWAIGGTVCALANDSNDIARVRGLVSHAETQALSLGVRDADGVVEVFHGIYRKTECMALQDMMAASWPFVLRHLNEVAPTESGKAMVVISTGKMTVPSYLEFLDTVAELVESGTLDRKFFMWAQYPPEGGLRNVLIKHYAENKAQIVIVRARKIFEDMPGKVATYDAMLTGESKKKLENYEARLAPPSSNQMGSDGASPVSNRVASTPMNAGRPSMESLDSSGNSEITPPSPSSPTPIRRSSGFAWPMLVLALAFLAVVAVWFLRRR